METDYGTTLACMKAREMTKPPLPLSEPKNEKPMFDTVNHPKHYNSHPSGIECITITENLSFCRGNAVKYLWRAGEKGSMSEDIKKAVWYIRREISLCEKIAAEGRFSGFISGYPQYIVDGICDPMRYQMGLAMKCLLSPANGSEETIFHLFQAVQALETELTYNS